MAKTHIKKSSTSLIIRKIKTKLQWSITKHQSKWPSSKNLQHLNAREGVAKRKASYTVGGNVNWYSREHYWTFLKKLKTELLYDSAIQVLGVDPEKTIIQKDTYTPVFIIAPYTIARTWKRSKCPSTEEWLKVVWYICKLKHYSAIASNETVSFTETWVDLETTTQSEVRKKLEKQIAYINICMWNLEKW